MQWHTWWCSVTVAILWQTTWNFIICDCSCCYEESMLGHVHRSSSGVHPSNVHHKISHVCVCVRACVRACVYQWSNVDSCVLLCSPISRALFDYFPAAGEHHAGNLSFYEGDIVEVSFRYHCIHVCIAVCCISTTVVCVCVCLLCVFRFITCYFTSIQCWKRQKLNFSEEFSWFFFTGGHRSAWILTVDPLKLSYIPFIG